MRLLQKACLACGLLASVQQTSAITIDVSSPDSVKAAAKLVAANMTGYYVGNQPGQTPGILLPVDIYYWWEAGAMMGALIDYWQYTGDTQYNDLVTQALLFQAGPGGDFMPQNQTKNEGNDDQAFWGMAVLQAAETKFPNPPENSPGWIALAQAIFNLQAARWDTTTCNGGLRWQIYWWNKGWDYKNSISQGCFFNIAARLGMYTGNATYFEWANKMWDWSENVGLIDVDYAVYDGTDDLLNCSKQDNTEWTYNNGVFLLGAAVMWNQTNGTTRALWEKRVQGFLDRGKIFFTGTNNQVMIEQACEVMSNCNTDQKSFKGYLARWMGATTKLAPWTTEQIMPYLRTSAQAVAQSCVAPGNGCSRNYNISGWDGQAGPGEQMAALEVIQANLVMEAKGPVTNFTGGIAAGDPSAGTRSGIREGIIYKPITTADQAGAYILTILLTVGPIVGTWWIVT